MDSLDRMYAFYSTKYELETAEETSKMTSDDMNISSKKKEVQDASFGRSRDTSRRGILAQ